MQAPLSSRVVINAYRCIEPLLKQLHSHVGTHHCCDTYHRQTATSTMRSYHNFTLPASVSVTVLDEPTHIQWRCTIVAPNLSDGRSSLQPHLHSKLSAQRQH